MIFRNSKGETVILPDSDRPILLGLEGTQAQRDNIVARQGMAVTVKSVETNEGLEDSIQYEEDKGMSSIRTIYGTFDDIANKNKFQNIRNAMFQSPRAYQYIVDYAHMAMPYPFEIVPKDDQPEENAGLNAIKYWKRVFEADKNNPQLHRFSRWADYYFRGWGECFFEMRMLRSPFLKGAGWYHGEMLKRLHLISPHLIKKNGIAYGKNNEIESITITNPANYENPELIIQSEHDLRRIKYLHNMPPNEQRGLSRLVPLIYWLQAYDDLRDLEIDIATTTGRAIEHWIIENVGVFSETYNEQKEDIEEQLSENARGQRKGIVTAGNVKFNMQGHWGKNADTKSVSTAIKKELSRGTAMPEGVTEGTETNKNTIDAQLNFLDRSQFVAHDQDFAKRLWEDEVFPVILYQRNISPLLCPTVQFPEISTATGLEKAQEDEIYATILGEPYIKKIAKRKGIRLPPNVQLVHKNNQQMMEKAIKERIGDAV